MTAEWRVGLREASGMEAFESLEQGAKFWRVDTGIKRDGWSKENKNRLEMDC